MITLLFHLSDSDITSRPTCILQSINQHHWRAKRSSQFSLRLLIITKHVYIYLTFEHTYLCLLMLLTLSWLCGRQHARIHFKQRSYCVFGLGNGIKRTPDSSVKYLESDLQVPQLQRFTMTDFLELYHNNNTTTCAHRVGACRTLWRRRQNRPQQRLRRAVIGWKFP